MRRGMRRGMRSGKNPHGAARASGARWGGTRRRRHRMWRATAPQRSAHGKVAHFGSAPVGSGTLGGGSAATFLHSASDVRHRQSLWLIARHSALPCQQRIGTQLDLHFAAACTHLQSAAGAGGGVRGGGVGGAAGVGLGVGGAGGGFLQLLSLYAHGMHPAVPHNGHGGVLQAYLSSVPGMHELGEKLGGDWSYIHAVHPGVSAQYCAHCAAVYTSAGFPCFVRPWQFAKSSSGLLQLSLGMGQGMEWHPSLVSDLAHPPMH